MLPNFYFAFIIPLLLLLPGTSDKLQPTKVIIQMLIDTLYEKKIEQFKTRIVRTFPRCTVD